MNKFAIGALALTTASSLAYAGGAETKEWSTFDRDILSLTSSQGPTTAGLIDVHGFVRARGAFSQEVDVDQPENRPDPTTPTVAGQPNGDQDLSGFNLDSARVEVNVSQGDYGALISVEAAGGIAQVLDAYGKFKIVEGITGQVGRFLPPFLWSSFMVNDNNLVTLDRTFNGQNWQGRQDGVQFGGLFEMGSQSIGWWAAMQNGRDGVENEYSYTGRLQFNLLGAGVGRQEGSLGSAAGETTIMIGGGYSVDQGVDQPGDDEGAAWCIDGALVGQGISLHVEVVDYQDHVRPDSALNLETGFINAVTVPVPASGAGQPFNPGTTGQSETPWSATAGYMLVPEKCEVVVRYEDLDDFDDTIVWTFALNYYLAGHNAKWTLQGSRSDSKDDAKEADVGAFGLTVGA